MVRLKGDAFGRPKFRDAIYGYFQKKYPEEDFVVLKTDGYPTYHLANVVDDHLMEITHVIRGEVGQTSTCSRELGRLTLVLLHRSGSSRPRSTSRSTRHWGGILRLLPISASS